LQFYFALQKVSDKIVHKLSENRGLLDIPRPVKPFFPEDPHAIEMRQSWSHGRFHSCLDLRLPNTEFSDVEIHQQAGVPSVALSDFWTCPALVERH
jgi:hypothetical protein